MFRRIALLLIGVAMLLTSMVGCASDRRRDATSSGDAASAGTAHVPCH
jgi:hypothetical protein